MQHGGARPNAGRKKGEPGKKQKALIEAAESTGLMPVAYLLGIMRDESADQKDRMDAAKNAAPYLHARLAAVEHTGKDGGPMQMEARTALDLSRLDPEERETLRTLLLAASGGSV